MWRIYDATNQFESKCGHWKFWINSGVPVYTCIVLGFGFQSYSFYTKKLLLATDARIASFMNRLNSFPSSSESFILQMRPNGYRAFPFYLLA